MVINIFSKRLHFQFSWPNHSKKETHFLSCPSYVKVFRFEYFIWLFTFHQVILEKKTNLIRYNKKWNWLITYSTLVVTFLFVRGFIAIIRKLNIENTSIQKWITLLHVSSTKRFMNLYPLPTDSWTFFYKISDATRTYQK